jgi:hypothetical protein
VRATLATIGDAECAPRARSSSATFAALDLAWFESRPLFGRSVVVTRAREQASELRWRLEELGAEVIELPSIALEPVAFSLPGSRRVPVARVHVGKRRRCVLSGRALGRRTRRPRARGSARGRDRTENG